MLKKIKTVSQEYNKEVSRCSSFTEKTRIYLFGIVIYSFEDKFDEKLKVQAVNNIGFNKSS